ncbi:MAG: sigma-70 family RNA polymerase sigma factor, partial [Clostridia bacterium]|nr:sigma-70 family RNA polymerase sigma factor [Clostridia bacterium]
SRLIAGDVKARDTLIEHNLRLVVYIARKFEISTLSCSIEDLISIGTIGLIKAVNTYCPGKNIKLATYASRCIENEILMYLRKTGNLRNEVSIEEPLNVDWDGNELLLSDVLDSGGDEVGKEIEREDEAALLKAEVSRLSHRSRTIIELRYGFSGGKVYTQKEVADLLGISQSYISRLEKKILGNLKERLKEIS